MTPKGRPRKGHQVQGDHIVLLVLLFSFDKKCPTFGPKIAQMSYFVLLLRVCVLLFNDGWRNDNFCVVLVFFFLPLRSNKTQHWSYHATEFFAAAGQEDPTFILICYSLLNVHAWLFTHDSRGSPARRPRQSGPKMERMLACICMEKEGAFRFEAWSMDSMKNGVFSHKKMYKIRAKVHGKGAGYFVDQQTSIRPTFVWIGLPWPGGVARFTL